MAARRDREFLIQSDQNRWKQYILPALATALPFWVWPLVLFMPGWARWCLLAVTIVWYGLLWRWWRRQRLGIFVSARGFTEWHWLRLPKRHRWDQVLEVHEDAEQAELVTERGTVHLDDNLRSWRRLVTRVRRELGEEVPEEELGPPVPPEQVEEWLGVQPGGVVRYGVLKTWKFWVPLLLTMTLFPAFLGLMTHSLRTALLGGVLCYDLPLALAMALAIWSQGTLYPLRIDAKGDGLVLHSGRGRRQVAWNMIRSVRRFAFWRFVCCADGDFLCHGLNRQGKQILAAIEQALAAREEGFALPRIEEVPEGAISQSGVGQEEVLVERGLSPSVE